MTVDDALQILKAEGFQLAAGPVSILGASDVSLAFRDWQGEEDGQGFPVMDTFEGHSADKAFARRSRTDTEQPMVFSPANVTWHCEGNAAYVIERILALEDPRESDF